MPSDSPSSGASSNGYQRFRPVLDRLVFGLALLGILTTVHLWIQQGRGFDRGCLGFSSPEQVEATFDCGAVVQSTSSTFLGLSNVYWGVGFYMLVLGLSMALVFVQDRRLIQLKQIRGGLIGVGFLYSGYLVYQQFFGLNALCALCLISAGIVTLLLATQLIDYFTGIGSTPVPPVVVSREVTLMSSLIVLVVGLIVADIVYFSSLTPSQQGQQQVAGAGPGSCGFAPDKDPIGNYKSLLSNSDPYVGPPDAPVTVIEYFDPNCPHCEAFYPVMKKVVSKYSDQVRFVFKPIPLWKFSVPQVEALYLAAQEGRFFQMLEQQFAADPERGLSVNQLVEMAKEIGMDSQLLQRRLEQEAVRGLIQGERKAAFDHGVESVPTVLVNGRFVASQSRTAKCLSQLIETAASN